MDSGFVTYQKTKGGDHPLLGENEEDDDSNGAYISAYQNEVE